MIILLIALNTLFFTEVPEFEIKINATELSDWVSNCPEVQESDILLIHGFLTSPDLENQRSESSIGHYYNFELSDLEHQHTDSFRSYWEKRGVKAISNPEICQKITNVLNSVNQVKKYFPEFEPIYYSAGDRFVILYRPKERKRLVQKGITPLQVLDNKFNLISNFKI